MSHATSMSTPVTRGELKEELAQFRQEIRQEIQQAIAPLATKAEIAPLATKAEIAPLATKAEIAPLATKAEIAQLATKAEIALLATKIELEIWGGALLARIQSSEQGLKELINATQQQLQADLARHAGALLESMSALITAHDDKYAGLPNRVARLEARVFAPRRR